MLILSMREWSHTCLHHNGSSLSTQQSFHCPLCFIQWTCIYAKSVNQIYFVNLITVFGGYAAGNKNNLPSCISTIKGNQVVYSYVCMSLKTYVLQISRKDLLSHDFEGIMKYFRVHLPKKFTSDEDCGHLFQTIDSMKAKEMIAWYVLV